MDAFHVLPGIDAIFCSAIVQITTILAIQSIASTSRLVLITSRMQNVSCHFIAQKEAPVALLLLLNGLCVLKGERSPPSPRAQAGWRVRGGALRRFGGWVSRLGWVAPIAALVVDKTAPIVNLTCYSSGVTRIETGTVFSLPRRIVIFGLRNQTLPYNRRNRPSRYHAHTQNGKTT